MASCAWFIQYMVPAFTEPKKRDTCVWAATVEDTGGGLSNARPQIEPQNPLQKRFLVRDRRPRPNRPLLCCAPVAERGYGCSVSVVSRRTGAVGAVQGGSAMIGPLFAPSLPRHVRLPLWANIFIVAEGCLVFGYIAVDSLIRWWRDRK